MKAYAVIATLILRFSDILKFYDVLLPPQVLETFNFALKKFKSFQSFVERLDSRSRKRMNVSLARIAEAICKYENDFSSGAVEYTPGEEEAEDFSRGIHSLVEKLKKVEEEYYTLLKDDQEKDHVSSSSSRVVSKSKMIGLRDQWRLLKDVIMVQGMDEFVFLIVGTAGIGKTTFAREIFEDLDIFEWFDCRVWISVGNKRRPEEIGEAILAQVDPEVHKMIMGGSKEEICEGLKQCLKGKRYLILLDDVWNKDVYEYLLSSIFDNQNGSHVLLTSRMKLVGLNDVAPCYPFAMRLLDKDESWDLLREKVFAGGSYPPHLKKVGEKIAEKCDGLPLTIITVADLLSKAGESVWIDVAKRRKHQLFIDAYDQISQVLYPSYEILNDELKLCFLYMGAFPQKYEITKSKLINLWIVEEFVQPRLNQTPESRAMYDLWNLDLHGIVMIYQKVTASSSMPYGVRIKKCGLHSSWWHFCQIEAKKTKCFLVLDCYNEGSLEESIEGHSRLSIHTNVLFALKHVHNSIEEICASTARSLLCFGPYNQYMVPVCFGLKLLLRLDALNIRFYDFPLEVLKLVKLRYLALTCNQNLPPSISNLQKLQYLIVHPHMNIKPYGALYNLPMEIWDMKRLKHLQVMGYDLPDLGDTSLQKLITLSDVTADSCIVLNRTPNLTMLRIRVELVPDVVEPLPCFEQISHLTKLESLKCVIVNPEFKLKVVSFPCLSFSLSKLSLSGMGYPWEEMSKIASLPNLKKLKLRFNAFRGPEWEVEENGFPNLLSLQMEDIDLVKLRWAHGSFKSLMYINISHCYKLKMLHFGNLPDIQEIEVIDSNPLVEWHVKNGYARSDFGVGIILVHSSWKS